MSEHIPEDQIAVAIDAVWSRRRKVHKQRARKLRRRGEFVWWDAELQSLVWIKGAA